jgi:hypothetical protein
MHRSLIVFSLIIFHPLVAHAVLGETAEPDNAARRMPAAFSVRSQIRETYTVRTVESDSSTIREFIAPTGIVFAVAWNGIAQPDLSILLGSYNRDYQNALKSEARALGRRSRAIRTERVVVEHWGHMRNLGGRAYAPSLLPEGVALDDIQ